MTRARFERASRRRADAARRIPGFERKKKCLRLSAGDARIKNPVCQVGGCRTRLCRVSDEASLRG